MIEKLNIAYAGGFEERKIDVFIPEGNRRNAGLFFIHGGWFAKGHRDQWHPVARYFCERGYTCASVGYRFAPEHPFPAQIEDVRLGMQYFLQHAGEFGFDARRVTALGSSAGGYLALMLGSIRENDPDFASAEIRMSTVPAAVVGYCPVTTLHMDVDHIVNYVGATEAEQPGKYAIGSPVDRITGEEPPQLILQGDADDITPLESAVQYYNRVKEAGGTAEMVTFTGIGHGFGYGVTTEAQKQSVEHVERFVREHS
ncbi:alpha/beta hydrolase [Paenibacillus humicola]|uniref:alpha/beta hydrolase n=1 Tax=Paenibacillus humicola TaxID=3110540 RepID=UPI00237B0A5B|nr:alpha/beta hydrolase [Paenibacillus humicola]